MYLAFKFRFFGKIGVGLEVKKILDDVIKQFDIMGDGEGGDVCQL